MKNDDYKRLRSLLFEIEQVLLDAPEEDECTDEENEIYENMLILKDSLENILRRCMNKKYNIRYTETYVGIYEVEAKSSEQAKEKFMEDMMMGKFDGPDECINSNVMVMKEMECDENE